MIGASKSSAFATGRDKPGDTMGLKIGENSTCYDSRSIEAFYDACIEWLEREGVVRRKEGAPEDLHLDVHWSGSRVYLQPFCRWSEARKQYELRIPTPKSLAQTPAQAIQMRLSGSLGAEFHVSLLNTIFRRDNAYDGGRYTLASSRAYSLGTSDEQVVGILSQRVSLDGKPTIDKKVIALRDRKDRLEVQLRKQRDRVETNWWKAKHHASSVANYAARLVKMNEQAAKLEMPQTTIAYDLRQLAEHLRDMADLLENVDLTVEKRW